MTQRKGNSSRTRSSARKQPASAPPESGQQPRELDNLQRDPEEDSEPPLDISESAGYDANSGPLETGYAAESTSLEDVLGGAARGDAGSSVDPEDLGPLALRGALQQEQDPPVEDPELEPELEDSLSLDTDDDAGAEDEDEDEDEDGDSEAFDEDDDNLDAVGLEEPSGVDLTQNVVREGSLFDQPRADLNDQTRRPLLKVDDLQATLERNERARRNS
jgi:hypothetical protein